MILYGLSKATLKKKSVSGRPGGIENSHPGGREFLFFFIIFFFLGGGG